MTRKRQTADALAAMAAADPAPTALLEAEIGEAEIERALTRAETLGRTPAQPIPPGDRVAIDLGRPPRRRRNAVGVGLAAALALVALLVLGGRLGGSDGGRPEFAAAAVRVAEANPRLLVTAPGWEVVRADEFLPDSGELVFSDGAHRLELRWYPARFYSRYLEDRAKVSAAERSTLLGRDATTVDYTRGEYATMLAPQGDVFVELRGRLGGRVAYEEVLHSLRPVDVETWLAAMPASAVRPDARAEAVTAMLRGIPLPAHFDASAVKNESTVSDRDSLAVAVGNAVACAWVGSWLAARAVDDPAGAREAVEALAGSPQWPIVRRTKVPWFTNYKIVAEQMRAGRLDWGDSGYEVRDDGRTFGFGPAWKLTLGCPGTHRREVSGLPR